MSAAASRCHLANMPPLRTSLRNLAQRFGYEVSRLHPERVGRSPYLDMHRFVPAGSAPLVLDVGANEGQTIRHFKEAYPRSVIHSFEPGTSTFARLREVVAGEENVSVWNCALGAAVGQQTFLENTNSDMSSFLELRADGWGSIARRASVEVMTVDHFLTTHGIESVDILKSDTQGYDLQVFRGAEKAMRDERIGMIFTELIFSDMYAGVPSFDEIYRHLADRGFRLVSIYHMEYQNDLAGWADALFVHPRYFEHRA
jgi:FkbM family methyltransferase